MAFTFRGTASTLNRISESQNQSGFQQVSGAGPRQGVGGESVSLEEAEKAFSKRNSSPTKRDVPLEHAEYHFKLRAKSVAKKCSPITQKASPLKINTTLVAGAATAANKFVDVRAAMGKGIDETYKQ